MLSTVLGVAALCTLLLVIFSLLDSKKHYIMQLLILVFVFSALILIPKAAIDAQNVCSSVVANTTVSGNTTSYAYTSHCFLRSETTGQTFMGSYLTLYGIIIGYIIVYLAIYAMINLSKSTNIKRK